MATPVQDQITALRSCATSERLIGLYGLGVEACTAKNNDDVTAVLQELIAMLDFEFAGVADGFRRVYAYCLEQVDAGNFDGVSFILDDLRDTLQRATADGTPAAP